MRIEDLPKHLQAEVWRQIGQRQPVAKETPPSAPVETRSSKGPNKTEAQYALYNLRGKDARYEAITFRMANRHRYTPDWVVFEDGRPVECHECKGGYALHSQQRARLAFDQARVEYPGLRWVWAVKTADGWRVEA